MLSVGPKERDLTLQHWYPFKKRKKQLASAHPEKPSEDRMGRWVFVSQAEMLLKQQDL